MMDTGTRIYPVCLVGKRSAKPLVWFDDEDGVEKPYSIKAALDTHLASFIEYFDELVQG